MKREACECCGRVGVKLLPGTVFKSLCVPCACEIAALNQAREDLEKALKATCAAWVAKWTDHPIYYGERRELVDHLMNADVFDTAASQALAEVGLHVERRSNAWFLVVAQ